ncbi:hypothetical protein RhiirA5_430987 [Rhizophagus irregularis]|uniref:Uncharacterized protein n=1 Tax=Rhizophagus irregularis TaxID=588596 RepID=A0A2I1ER05_9GLOM|nr:hypothetical protein RhiirA5_430987 [Rhizophagus irregularis]PKC52291.1 hypothetical protein RhiirA1_481841 [Rhizophagus irregularis]PKY24560.1 hypothetical protein RhiirB3_439177 [Rhizophagus irregularis]CAB5359144.1 unnamed protein product [Rhizophagus irregularis]
MRQNYNIDDNYDDENIYDYKKKDVSTWDENVETVEDEEPPPSYDNSTETNLHLQFLHHSHNKIIQLLNEHGLLMYSLWKKIITSHFKYSNLKFLHMAMIFSFLNLSLIIVMNL